MLTATEAWDKAVLASLIGSATLLGADLKAGLYVNPINPTKVLALGDLVEPAYASYVRQSVVMGAVFRDPLNGIAALGSALLWQMTGTPTPTIIQGVFYMYGATATLLGIEPLQTPLALNDDLDAFSTILEYIESNASQGFSTIIR